MNAVVYSGFFGTIPKTIRSFFSSIFLNGTPGIFFRSFMRATHFNAGGPPRATVTRCGAAYATLPADVTPGTLALEAD